MYYESEIIEPVELEDTQNQFCQQYDYTQDDDCRKIDNYQGYNQVPFNYSEKPKNKTGYHILNPQLQKNKYNADFDRIKVDDKCVYVTSIPDGSVKSNMHDGQYTLLDKPCYDSGIPISNLQKLYTDESLDNYKTGYKQYNEIQGGDITYYVNRQNEEPFFSPVFSGDFNTTSVLYKDPMGGVTPQYLRYPNGPTNKITDRNSFDYNLSWIEDSNEYREDLLAWRMQKLNKNRWDARWNAPDL